MTGFRGLYSIRDYKSEDKNFIMATFLKGLYYGFDESEGSWFRQIDKDIFMANYSKIAEKLLTQAQVKVACLPEDPDVIIGYSILSNDFLTIHYCFVKSAWRNKGVGRSLVPAYPTQVSHLTAAGKKLLSKLNSPKFNPWAIGE